MDNHNHTCCQVSVGFREEQQNVGQSLQQTGFLPGQGPEVGIERGLSRQKVRSSTVQQSLLYLSHGKDKTNNSTCLKVCFSSLGGKVFEYLRCIIFRICGAGSITSQHVLGQHCGTCLPWVQQALRDIRAWCVRAIVSL